MTKFKKSSSKKSLPFLQICILNPLNVMYSIITVLKTIDSQGFVERFDTIILKHANIMETMPMILALLYDLFCSLKVNREQLYKSFSHGLTNIEPDIMYYAFLNDEMYEELVSRAIADVIHLRELTSTIFGRYVLQQQFDETVEKFCALKKNPLNMQLFEVPIGTKYRLIELDTIVLHEFKISGYWSIVHDWFSTGAIEFGIAIIIEHSSGDDGIMMMESIQKITSQANIGFLVSEMRMMLNKRSIVFDDTDIYHYIAKFCVTTESKARRLDLLALSDAPSMIQRLCMIKAGKQWKYHTDPEYTNDKIDDDYYLPKRLSYQNVYLEIMNAFGFMKQIKENHSPVIGII